MENTNTFKVQSTSSNLISLNVTPGHYACLLYTSDAADE